MTQDILDAHFELDSVCNYLHFALQSGDDKMLKRMNRRHNYQIFKDMVDYLRSKDSSFSISTDIIVGYS
jgi:tRNA A37 methylthiotransferase MiaB